jgi:ElaB/YqjD/DUF883 family membrane-anchored ribosome-binding protein
MNSLPEAGREIARRAAEATREAAKGASTIAHDLTDEVEDIAGDVSDAAKDAAKRLTDSAKDVYQSAARKAGDTMETSRDFVGRNPVSVVFGAIAFGAAIGVVLFLARRKPTLRERYVDDPLLALRDALVGTLSPVAHRIHEGYDSAREGAEKAMDQVYRLRPGRTGGSLSGKIACIGNNLKFW